MKQNQEKKLAAEYLYVAVFTTVTVMLWVGFEVVRAVTTPADIPQVTKEELTPLNPGFDENGLSIVRDRLHIPQEMLDGFEVTPAATLLETTVTEATAGAGTEPVESVRIESEGEEATTSGAI